jgi:hypothetical protein
VADMGSSQSWMLKIGAGGHSRPVHDAVLRTTEADRYSWVGDETDVTCHVRRHGESRLRAATHGRRCR